MALASENGFTFKGAGFALLLSISLATPFSSLKGLLFEKSRFRPPRRSSGEGDEPGFLDTRRRWASASSSFSKVRKSGWPCILVVEFGGGSLTVLFPEIFLDDGKVPDRVGVLVVWRRREKAMSDLRWNHQSFKRSSGDISPF